MLMVIDLSLILQHFPEILVLIDQHLYLIFNIFTMLLIKIIAIAVQFFNGFCKLSVNFNKLFQALLQYRILLLQLLISLLQFLILALSGKVVLESVRHCVDFIWII